MANRDQEVRSYVHLDQFPRADEALLMLRRVASAVKPIMRNHGWRVGELSEMYPEDQENLLGLNYSKGERVCLRLRHARDKTLFLELEEVIDTMLHELCHNEFGPHNDAFHALWEELRDEHLRLQMAGYTGEGFLGKGRRLGGTAAEVPARGRGGRIPSGGGVVAVAAGHRLGGGGPSRLTPGMRRAAAAAAAEERRRRAMLEGCGAGSLSETQRRAVADTARRNGRMTRAEEDRANEEAIARALAELMDEEEGRPPRPPPVTAQSRRQRVTRMAGERRRRRGGGAGWACAACTLHNREEYLFCDACGGERGERVVIDLT